MQSFTYKTVDGCAIRADVYSAVGTRGPTPAVIWFHGGALMWGSCDYMTRPEQVDLYTRAGYTYIAMDYRLAPESKLPDITADVVDGIRWVRAKADRLGIDPARIGVIGHSAGGYLALMAGVLVDPPVQAIVSLYGYVDMVVPWREPSASPESAAMTEAAARAVVGTAPRSMAGRERGAFYAWCRAHGRWRYEVSGIPVAAGNEALIPWCPARRVHVRFPPTLLIHGDADGDVPHAQSIQMASALAVGGIENELIILPGRGHVFDDAFSDVDVRTAFAAILKFLARHLRGGV